MPAPRAAAFPRSLKDLLTNSRFLQNLCAYGFAAGDLSKEAGPFLHALRAEILDLHAQPDRLQPNWSRFVQPSGQTTALQKAGIFEQNLPLGNAADAGAVTSTTVALDELWGMRSFVTETINMVTSETSTATSTTTNINGAVFPQLLEPSIKIQVNQGEGACFPCHYDSDAKVDDRCVTMIFYLNPEWLRPAHSMENAADRGGHLVCFPLPFRPVSFAPAAGRVVAFSSRNMLHRTLPCSSTDPRCCLTLWFPEDKTASATASAETAATVFSPTDFEDFYGATETEAKALAVLMEPEARVHFARLVLSGEWIQSLRDSHDDVAIDADTMALVSDDGVSKYVESMVGDLHAIEAALVDRVQSRLGDASWSANDLRMLASKLPLKPEGHEAGKGGAWWL
jgi:hypothetical protein